MKILYILFYSSFVRFADKDTLRLYFLLGEERSRLNLQSRRIFGGRGQSSFCLCSRSRSLCCRVRSITVAVYSYFRGSRFSSLVANRRNYIPPSISAVLCNVILNVLNHPQSSVRKWRLDFLTSNAEGRLLRRLRVSSIFRDCLCLQPIILTTVTSHRPQFFAWGTVKSGPSLVPHICQDIYCSSIFKEHVPQIVSTPAICPSLWTFQILPACAKCRVVLTLPGQAQLSRNLALTILLHLSPPNHPLPFSRVEAGSDNKQLVAAGTVDGLRSVVAAGALRSLPSDILNSAEVTS